MIFVDTSAWFASVVPWDADHRAASDWLNQQSEPLFTTDYVIDETLTLLQVRGERRRALALGWRFFTSTLAFVHYVSPDEVGEAWKIFEQFHDKSWSFTDCVRKVVIERLKIMKAFSFDQHFHQFGSVQVVP